MPDVERLIKAAVRGAGSPQWIVETDYALTFLIAGVSAVPELERIAVFKGGTCLRKAYFREYRFSADLDYTLIERRECDELLELVRAATVLAEELLNERGPFSLDARAVKHRHAHERGQCEFKVSVRFPWMRQPMCSLKIELLPSPPEVVVGTTEVRAISHQFEADDLEVQARCYSIEEIAAEKLRAFLQMRANFDDPERGWLRTRPRDLYDIAHLHEQREIAVDHARVAEMLKAKVQAFHLSFEGAKDFLDERVMGQIASEWEARLRQFVPRWRTFDECEQSYRAFVAKVLV